MKNGLYCSAGYNYLSIGAEGNIYLCNLLNYNPTGLVGNIFDLNGDFRLRADEYDRCPIQRCESGCDRQWTRKKVYENDQEVDFQPLAFEAQYHGLKRPAFIMWGPTWVCSYHCKYCTLPDVLNSGPDGKSFPAKGGHTAEEWIAVFDRFLQINGLDGGIVSVSGGEPTSFPGIGKVLNFFHQRNFKIGMVSNMATDTYRVIVKEVPPQAFSGWNASLHLLERTFDMNIFKSKVLMLKSLGYPVTVTLVGHPDQVMMAPELHEYFTQRGVGFTIIPMVGEFDGVGFKSIADYPPPMQEVINRFTQAHNLDDNRFVKGRRLAEAAVPKPE